MWAKTTIVPHKVRISCFNIEQTHDVVTTIQRSLLQEKVLKMSCFAAHLLKINGHRRFLTVNWSYCNDNKRTYFKLMKNVSVSKKQFGEKLLKVCLCGNNRCHNTKLQKCVSSQNWTTHFVRRCSSTITSKEHVSKSRRRRKWNVELNPGKYHFNRKDRCRTHRGKQHLQQQQLLLMLHHNNKTSQSSKKLRKEKMRRETMRKRI